MKGPLKVPPEPQKVHRYLCICTWWLKDLCYCTKCEQQLTDLLQTFPNSDYLPLEMQRAQSLKLLRSLRYESQGISCQNLLPPSLNKGRPGSECAVFSEMLMSYCGTVFLAFSHIDCPSSFYFQLPYLYLEDAMYSLPLKLMGPESHIQILML